MTDPGLGENTRAVHGPTPPVPPEPPVGLPVYRTAVFGFATAEDYADVLNDVRPGYVYSRIDNPTADAFASALLALETAGVDGDFAAQPFASGMAAISTTLLALCQAGSNVVLQRPVYGGTVGVLLHILSRFDVTHRFVDGPAEAEAAITADTAAMWAETIANPMLGVADLPGLAEVAHSHGVPLVVDSTFATPVVCRPLRHGADLVVHSATKYIGGHSDVTGGAVLGDRGLVRRVRTARVDLGGSLAPDEAWLLHRGLQTLPLRVERHCTNALTVARALEGHQNLEMIRYPGLPGHPDHPLAVKLFEGDRFGGVVTVVPVGGRLAGQRLCDELQLASNATSLGGTHTVVSHVASTTHRQLDDDGLAAAGIPPGAVRISVGLEEAEDVAADFARALDRLH